MKTLLSIIILILSCSVMAEQPDMLPIIPPQSHPSDRQIFYELLYPDTLTEDVESETLPIIEDYTP